MFDKALQNARLATGLHHHHNMSTADRQYAARRAAALAPMDNDLHGIHNLSQGSVQRRAVKSPHAVQAVSPSRRPLYAEILEVL